MQKTNDEKLIDEIGSRIQEYISTITYEEWDEDIAINVGGEVCVLVESLVELNLIRSHRLCLNNMLNDPAGFELYITLLNNTQKTLMFKFESFKINNAYDEALKVIK